MLYRLSSAMLMVAFFFLGTGLTLTGLLITGPKGFDGWVYVFGVLGSVLAILAAIVSLIAITMVRGPQLEELGRILERAIVDHADRTSQDGRPADPATGEDRARETTGQRLPVNRHERKSGQHTESGGGNTRSRRDRAVEEDRLTTTPVDPGAGRRSSRRSSHKTGAPMEAQRHDAPKSPVTALESHDAPPPVTDPDVLIEVWDVYRTKGNGQFNAGGLKRHLRQAKVEADVLDGYDVDADDSVLGVVLESGSRSVYLLPSFLDSPQAVTKWFDDQGGGHRTARVKRLVRLAVLSQSPDGYGLQERGAVA